VARLLLKTLLDVKISSGGDKMLGAIAGDVIGSCKKGDLTRWGC